MGREEGSSLGSEQRCHRRLPRASLRAGQEPQASGASLQLAGCARRQTPHGVSKLLTDGGTDCLFLVS